MTIINEIKQLGAKLLGGGATAADNTGKGVAGALAYISDHLTPSTVSAVALSADADGVITGGTLTMSDGTSVAITIAAAGD